MHFELLCLGHIPVKALRKRSDDIVFNGTEQQLKVILFIWAYSTNAKGMTFSILICTPNNEHVKTLHY